MGRNSEIKKAIKQEFKPSKPFEEFCREHNIVFEEEKLRHEEKPRRKAFSFDWIKAVTATVVTVAVLIMILLPLNSDSSHIPPIDYYGDNDVVMVTTSYENLLADSIVVPINFENVEQYGRILQIQSKDNSNLVLGYMLEDVLFGFLEDDKLLAYKLKIVIRCYDKYIFTATEFFKNLEFTYNINNITYNFGISKKTNVAYIRFINHNFEYFITLSDYANIIEINKTNVELFLDHLI